MGIPGILKEIGKGERIALSKLAVEHLERTRRPLRIAIDAAIWQFQNQAGQGGKNPALRTLFFRLLKLLALPIHPVFIYDGKNKPLTKRNKSVASYGTCISNEMSKKLVQAFRFPYHTAPGEAEAECALLQKRGIVDAVMSQDVDAIMFGSTLTLRDWSKEGSRGNKTATHVNALRQAEIKQSSNLDPEGMILVALLSGGDYNTDGLPGFGPALACEIAKAGFGADLLELIEQDKVSGLQEWRERLQFELETNESGYFKTKHKTLKIPETFPDRTILGYYTKPAVSAAEHLPRLETNWLNTWDQELDILALREYVADTLDWRYRSGARKFIRCLAPVLLAHRLRRGMNNTTLASADSIKEERRHFLNDGISELRVEAVPADIVGLNLEAEEDNPAFAEELADEAEEVGLGEDLQDVSSEPKEPDQQAEPPQGPAKARKSPPWDPYVPEKMWVPQTIVQLGVPALVEEWQQRQRDLLADPIKFATRKCPKSKKPIKATDRTMKPGALDSFFKASKPTTKPSKSSENGQRPPLQTLTDGNASLRSREPICHSHSGQASTTQQSSLHKDGASSNSSILISSSPLTPSTPRKGGIALKSSSSLSGSPDRLVAVIQRRTNSQRDGKAASATTGVDRPLAARKPIESFFNPRKPTCEAPSAKVLTHPISGPSQTPFLPPDLSTGLMTRITSTKLTVVSRDSLPGTWKAVAENDNCRDSTRSRPRVSIVDLTGD